MFISNAQAQSLIPALDSSSVASFLPLILMLVAFYFLLMRPQIKRQKEQQAMIDGLSNGDEIVTTGGVLGTITKTSPTFITLDVGNNVTITIQRTAVTSILPKGTIKSAR